MNRSQSMHSSVQYGRKLVSAGISGIRNGQDSARGEQPLSTIAASIPHPTLDACLADIEIRKLWNIFAPKYARNRAQGPPPIGGWPADAEYPTP